MQQFLSRPDGHLGIYTPENLKDMNDMLALENKIVSWENALGISKKGQSA